MQDDQQRWLVSVLAPVVDDGVMSKSGPRAGGPRPRRTFTAAEKLRHLAAYEVACHDGQGGGYLRREGLYSSQITEWRKLRDGGVLEEGEPGAKVGRLSAEQAEIARLRTHLSEAERRLASLGVSRKLVRHVR
jgi:transposase